MATGEARVTITRGTAYVDRARAYKIMLDGQEVGRIKNNTSETIPVPAGPHELFLKVDWASSPTATFDAAPGQEVRYACRPTSNAFLALITSVFARKNYITLEPEG
jgi:hypothetical protein